MSILGFVGNLSKAAFLWAAIGVVLLCLVVGAFGFIAAALFIWMASHVGAAAAAALMALILLVFAVIILLIGRLVQSQLRTRRLHLFADPLAIFTAVISVAGLVVRRNPKYALALSLLAGILTEYLGNAGRDRDG